MKAAQQTSGESWKISSFKADNFLNVASKFGTVTMMAANKLKSNFGEATAELSLHKLKSSPANDKGYLRSEAASAVEAGNLASLFVHKQATSGSAGTALLNK